VISDVSGRFIFFFLVKDLDTNSSAFFMKNTRFFF
ncbi:MAG: hypothetical protein ACI920_002992, partial [Saprospiraceae bacterium]